MYKAWTTDPTVLFHQLFGQSDDNFAGSKRFIKGLTVWYLESFYYSFLCNFFQWIFCLFGKAWCYCQDCPRIERNNPLKPPHEPYVDMCWWVDELMRGPSGILFPWLLLVVKGWLPSYQWFSEESTQILMKYLTNPWLQN